MSSKLCEFILLFNDDNNIQAPYTNLHQSSYFDWLNALICIILEEGAVLAFPDHWKTRRLVLRSKTTSVPYSRKGQRQGAAARGSGFMGSAVGQQVTK